MRPLATRLTSQTGKLVCLGLVSLSLTACGWSWFGKEDMRLPLHIISIQKDSMEVVQDKARCDNFVLNRQQVKDFFQLANELDSEENEEEIAAQQAVTTDCKYKGVASYEGQAQNWEIQVSGAGRLYNEETALHYLCKDACCGALPNLCE